MEKSIATFWPPFPPQRLRRPVIFWNHPLPFKTYLTALQSGKIIALKERLPCPRPVSKLPGPSVSPPPLFSENSLSNVLQTDVKCRSDVTKWLSLVYSWPSVSTCGSAPAAAQHRLTSFFQKFQTKRHWNHLVLKMEILIDQNQGC